MDKVDIKSKDLEKLKDFRALTNEEQVEMFAKAIDGALEKELIKLCPIAAKKLKALEIIKCLLFNKCKVYETSEKATATTITKGNYYVVELKINNERFYIGKEEYVLLKEVLL